MPKAAKKSAERRPLKCSECDKTYSSISHLRRHEATHGSHRLITCRSCLKSFSRLDVARRHNEKCGTSDQNLIIPFTKRGKDPRACDRCSRLKLSCDSGTPCSRCHSGGLPCSYQRIDALQAPPRSINDGATAEFPRFLRLTDPSAAGTTEVIARDTEIDDVASGYTWDLHAPMMTDRQWANPGLDDEPCPFTGRLGAWAIPLYPNPMLDYDELDGQTKPPSQILDDRLEALATQLAKTDQSLSRQGASLGPHVDLQLARSTFTAQNLQYFVWVYFRRVQPYHPIIHPATFTCETTSLPLLLAIFLFGSLYAAPVDDAISASDFFDIAEEYIFNHPEMGHLLASNNHTTTTTSVIEILQAALTILVLQNSRNDMVVRRRIRVERLPRLNTAIRSSGILHLKRQRDIMQNNASTWQEFIKEEVAIRIAHWSQFHNDYMLFSSNSHAQRYMCEMAGDMPCRWEVFEAESPQTFAQAVASEAAGPPPQSLTKSIAMLLEDSWPGPDGDAYKRTTPEILTLVINALSHVIVLARTNCLFPAVSKSLPRACARWRSLWDAAMLRQPGGKISRPGFENYAVETWWFCMAIIEIEQSPDLVPHFKTNMGADTLTDLNKVLSWYQNIKTFYY